MFDSGGGGKGNCITRDIESRPLHNKSGCFGRPLIVFGAAGFC